jgi:hypothetical protein
MRTEYTHEQLAALKLQLERELTSIEGEEPSAQPLPPTTEEESKDLLLALMQTASQRLLTPAESFLAGQLLVTYRMAVEARMLGKKNGRYFVISEDDIARSDARVKARQEAVRRDTKP